MAIPVAIGPSALVLWELKVLVVVIAPGPAIGGMVSGMSSPLGGWGSDPAASTRQPASQPACR